MKKLILVFVSVAAFAANIRFEWDPGDPAEEVQLNYLYGSTNVNGPYTVVGTSTTNGLTLTNVQMERMFYYVTASNFWGESLPSNIVNTPAAPTLPKGLLLSLLSTEGKSYVMGLVGKRRPQPPLP